MKFNFYYPSLKILTKTILFFAIVTFYVDCNAKDIMQSINVDTLALNEITNNSKKINENKIILLAQYRPILNDPAVTRINTIKKVNLASSLTDELNGEWFSNEWKYSYSFNNGVGIATTTNSPNFTIGQEIIFLKALSKTLFEGKQVYKDGKFYSVIAELKPDGRLYFKGEKNVNWFMIRKSINEQKDLRKISIQANYPSSVIPKLEMCAVNVDSLNEICFQFDRSEKIYDFDLPVPPGNYYFYVQINENFGEFNFTPFYLNTNNIFDKSKNVIKKVIDLHNSSKSDQLVLSWSDSSNPDKLWFSRRPHDN